MIASRQQAGSTADEKRWLPAGAWVYSGFNSASSHVTASGGDNMRGLWRCTYGTLVANPANNILFRVHQATGRGVLVPNTGFVASGCPLPINGPTHVAHVNQWINQTGHQPSSFLSTSFSFAYALFEVNQWNMFHNCNNTQISAMEVLIFECIPYSAVVVTAPLATFLAGLPRWCDDVKARILSGQLHSTEEVAVALRAAAAANNTPQQEGALVLRSITHSVQMLWTQLPASMVNYDRNTHAAAVNAMACLATMFVWWPKWITSVNPATYLACSQQVRAAFLQELRLEKVLALVAAMHL
ncbi:hypothetical protein DFH07DRAFT_764887 [Mycena maculata]|uniref:Uncharacterized protein n=1 Tax=Mycena maculata TaxID=230809 RepID=A0AAD7KAR0_9AGAR|nr:hypothetical protein DFH07DRAFT_764887 [Mycena maculata]